jgi:hypothetical protein
MNQALIVNEIQSTSNLPKDNSAFLLGNDQTTFLDERFQRTPPAELLDEYDLGYSFMFSQQPYDMNVLDVHEELRFPLDCLSLVDAVQIPSIDLFHGDPLTTLFMGCLHNSTVGTVTQALKNTCIKRTLETHEVVRLHGKNS